MPGQDGRNSPRQAKDKRKLVIYGILREEKCSPQAQHEAVHRETSSYEHTRDPPPVRSGT